MATITNKQKAEVFKDLVKVSAYQAGVRAGIDRYYKNKWSLIAFIRRVEKEVRDNPKKFGISDDTISMVDSALVERKTKKISVIGQEMFESPKVGMADYDIKDLVERGSKKSLLLLHAKMDMIGDSKKQLRETSISALAQLVGIMFDKRQISKGEATEHINMRAKIDIDEKSPEEALQVLLNMREQMINGDE